MKVCPRGLMVSTCTLAVLSLLFLGGMEFGMSSRACEHGELLALFTASFLFFMSYHSLPLTYTKSAPSYTARDMFAFATIVGLCMSPVIAMNSPGSHPPRLVNEIILIRSPRNALLRRVVPFSFRVDSRHAAFEALRIRHAT